MTQMGEDISGVIEGDGAGPLILHPVGLPSFLTGDRPATDEIAQLREISARPNVELWNGGYAGAPGDHLTAEELAWDLTWARTNPWDSGLSRHLQAVTTADFPVLVTESQARHLGDDQIPHQGPLCLGYAGDTLSPPGGGPRELWFLEEGHWKWLTSLFVVLPENGQLPPADSETPADCLHIVLSGPYGEGEVEAIRDRVLSASSPEPSLRAASAPPQGTFFHSGVDRRGRWLMPERAAAVARIRSSQRASRDRTAAILRAAAGIVTPVPLTSGTPTAHDPFGNRELQGGVTGRLRLDTDSLGAVFSGGRIAGLTYGDAVLTPAVRSQGFLQTTATTRYLETVSAAWFTGLRVRGVHEVAEIAGDLRLGITLFAMDQLPGLVLNITGERSEKSIKSLEAVLRHGALEIPLCDTGGPPTELRGAILDGTGAVRQITPFPDLPAELPDGESPLEWSVGAPGVRLDLPAASLWFISAHPGAVLPVPFLLGARAISGGYRISWYPAGFGRSTVGDSRHCPRWSVSYRILAAGRESGTPVSPRVEHDLATEIDGFTCQAGSARRSVPAT